MNTQRYPTPVSPEKLIGIGVLDESAAKAATDEHAAFCFVAPFMAAHSRSRKARQLLLRRFTGTPTRLGCRLDWRREGSFTTEPLEAIMAKSLARRTAPRIAVVDGQPTTTSRDIAETFGKRHDDVLKRIRALDCSAEFRLRNFAETLRDVPGPNGSVRKETEYRITRDGFAFLCMGFTGAKAAAWKEKYINTFNRLAQVAQAAGKAKLIALPRAEPTLNMRDLLLTGQSEPVTLTSADHAAINRHAWMLSHEAYELIRQHIERRVAFTTTPAHRQLPGHVDAVVRSVTLGNSLAHRQHDELRGVLKVMEIAKSFADTGLAALQKAVATMHDAPNNTKEPK